MAEAITMILGNVKEYDAAVRYGTPQASDITIITRDHAMVSGAGGAVVSFKTLVDNEIMDVQAVTSVLNLLNVLSALKGRYDAEGHLLAHHISDGSEDE